MDIKFENNITPEEFLEMIEAVGWKPYTREQVERALKNTMYMVKVTVDGKLAGIGRIVGDFGVVCMLTTICVKPEYQKNGIGLSIIKTLKEMVENDVKPGERILIELNPIAGLEHFYEKAGFKYKPEKITGMYLWIQK